MQANGMAALNYFGISYFVFRISFFIPPRRFWFRKLRFELVCVPGVSGLIPCLLRDRLAGVRMKEANQVHFPCQFYFLPWGLGFLVHLTHGLRPGLHSFAASQLVHRQGRLDLSISPTAAAATSSFR